MSNDTTTIMINGSEFDPGCYVGGHSGQYGGAEMVEIADDALGTTFLAEWPRNEDGSVMGTYGSTGSPWAGLNGDDDVETMVDIMDRAESALNEATEGGYWTWEDGEFFLIANGSEEDDEMR